MDDTLGTQESQTEILSGNGNVFLIIDLEFPLLLAKPEETLLRTP